MTEYPSNSQIVRYENSESTHGITILGGCGEFSPGGCEGMFCTACNCHRVFHRREEMAGADLSHPLACKPRQARPLFSFLSRPRSRSRLTLSASSSLVRPLLLALALCLSLALARPRSPPLLLSLALALCLFCCRSPSGSRCLSLALVSPRSPPLLLSLALAASRPRSLPLFLSLALRLSLPFSRSRSPSLPLALALCLIASLLLSLALTLALAPTLAQPIGFALLLAALPLIQVFILPPQASKFASFEPSYPATKMNLSGLTSGTGWLSAMEKNLSGKNLSGSML
ncbi:uncharacterized protein LOC127793135 [Diospyros lotus]|uniref:uncharacterized protein LOC127793135 n=1 Tax=Diospyros lotus TaxID=55363 RepID=UPI002253EBEB|nr:uncharacterized protein LOC127793135 [Diospyros lotus]